LARENVNRQMAALPLVMGEKTLPAMFLALKLLLF
jgi:hypothetical protein